MSMTNFAENLVLTWLLTNSAATRPTAWYIGLFTAAPGETGGGTEVSTSGTAYARVAVTFTISGTAPTQGANSATLDYPTATGSGFGTVTHAALFDASTSGNMLWYGALSASVAIAAGDIFRWAAGAFVLTLD
jgi:hypothetical protein